MSPQRPRFPCPKKVDWFVGALARSSDLTVLFLGSSGSRPFLGCRIGFRACPENLHEARRTGISACPANVSEPSLMGVGPLARLRGGVLATAD